MTSIHKLLNPIDIANLENSLIHAKGFPHFCIDNFLIDEFASEIESSFPTFDHAVQIGRSFNSHYEKKKVQITNLEEFPVPVRKLSNIFGDKKFISLLENATGIEPLLYDQDFIGGGMHMTNGGGRLDVHVDFNYIEEKKWYRRLNFLLYFNKNWEEEYGGYLELWDASVKNRIGYYAPKFNRLCGFVTSEISFHGVTPLRCPNDRVRKSFAIYYYTKDNTPDISDKHHSTIFVPRPTEWKRQLFCKPINDLTQALRTQIGRVKNKLTRY